MTEAKDYDCCSASIDKLNGYNILIIIENLPVPFDRRMWQEACTLRDAGAQVVVICPVSERFTARYELLEDIHIYRHPLPLSSSDLWGYLKEYSAALFWESALAWKILFKHGFDIIHGCNPPDLIFLVAWQFRLLGKRYIFDHHDLNPELYEVKFGRQGLFLHLLRIFEWLTFKTARVVIATNESYKNIAIKRGGKRTEDVFVVRSGPNLARIQSLPPDFTLKNGRKFLVGYVGVMGEQDGIDLLLDAITVLIYNRYRHDIQFVLVGDGPVRLAMQHRVQEFKLAEYVSFTGFQFGDSLNRILSSIDIGVCPDPCNNYTTKCTMNKIMEYMAMGKPLVQFDLIEGRFSSGDASLYARPNDPVDLADKIADLLDDEPTRLRMGTAGRKRLETELAWHYEAPKLVAAYHQAMEKQQTRRLFSN